MSQTEDSCANACKCASASSTRQTLYEMDWSRGIWNAALDGDMSRVKKLLASGTDAGARDLSGYTALHYAARSGHITICQTLLEHGAPVDAATRAGGATPLHRAAAAGQKKAVELLVAAGAKVNLADHDGQTALHRAADYGHRHIILYLLKLAPELKNVRDKRGLKPVDCVKDNKLKTLFE